MVQVSFNKRQEEAFKEIKDFGLISETFPSFVKKVFHNELDKLNKEKLHLSMHTYKDKLDDNPKNLRKPQQE